MVATKPGDWLATPLNVDPRWQKIWQRPSVLFPMWENGTGGNNAPADLVWPSHDYAGQLSNHTWADTPYGRGMQLSPSLTRSTTMDQPGQWSGHDTACTWFIAWWQSAIATGGTDLWKTVRGAAGKRGAWEIEFNHTLGGHFEFNIWDDSASLTTYDFVNGWNTAGYHSMAFVRDGTDMVHYLDGALVERNTASYPAGSIGTTALGSDAMTMNWDCHSSHTMVILSAFLAPGAILNEDELAALHDDPWAWVRPRRTNPAIFVSSDGPGPSPVTGTAALTPGPASVSASGAHGVAGTSVLTPGAAQVAASGIAAVIGTASVTPGAASVSAVGSHPVSGTAALAPGAAIVAAAGTHALPVTGTAALTPGAASVDASGYALVTGAAALTPAGAQVSGAGGHGVVGLASLTSGAANVAAVGTASEPSNVVGTAALTPAAAKLQAWGLVVKIPFWPDIGDDEILEVGLPYSVNSIINGALDLIASNGIQGLGDSSSHVGNSIKRSFDVERDALLREYPWNFAMNRATLAASATAPTFRFAYAYELPAGPSPEYCLRVWAVGNEDSRLDSDVWEISGRRLLTDLGPALPIRYIGRIVNPARWDALAVKALEARLAWQAAYLASGSAALAEQMARIYRERLEAAKTIDAQEGTPEPFEDGTTWVDSRQVGTW